MKKLGALIFVQFACQSSGDKRAPLAPLPAKQCTSSDCVGSNQQQTPVQTTGNGPSQTNHTTQVGAQGQYGGQYQGNYQVPPGAIYWIPTSQGGFYRSPFGDSTTIMQAPTKGGTPAVVIQQPPIASPPVKGSGAPSPGPAPLPPRPPAPPSSSQGACSSSVLAANEVVNIDGSSFTRTATASFISGASTALLKFTSKYVTLSNGKGFSVNNFSPVIRLGRKTSNVSPVSFDANHVAYMTVDNYQIPFGVLSSTATGGVRMDLINGTCMIQYGALTGGIPWLVLP